MGKLACLTSGKSITPGIPVVQVISAEKRGGNAEKLLRKIGSSWSGSRTSRQFPSEWNMTGESECLHGVVTFGRNEYSVSLKVGVTEGLVLRDVPGEDRSLKPEKNSLVLEIGEKISEAQLSSFANDLVCSWVVHGRDWLNRRGDLIRQPYGLERKSPFETFQFNVIDGRAHPYTLGELIALGCTRSTHVGEWHNRHSTLIAAGTEMPITMHEFKKDGDDVCAFRGVQISKTNPSGCWGAYCQWDDATRRPEYFGSWYDLAVKASSPFAFHIHATRTLFPHAQLDSAFLLNTVGQGKLNAALELMTEKEPERFDRLIDEHGVTQKLMGVTPTQLLYNNGNAILRKSVAGNILQTFQQLQRLQADARYELPRMPRVVIDTHAYLVIESLAFEKKVVYALSGRDMHRYLLEGGSAGMHKIRNERLFLLLREIFGVSSINFYVYPPLDAHSGLESQYGDWSTFDRTRWLTQ